MDPDGARGREAEPGGDCERLCPAGAAESQAVGGGVRTHRDGVAAGDGNRDVVGESRNLSGAPVGGRVPVAARGVVPGNRYGFRGEGAEKGEENGKAYCAAAGLWHA